MIPCLALLPKALHLHYYLKRRLLQDKKELKELQLILTMGLTSLLVKTHKESTCNHGVCIKDRVFRAVVLATLVWASLVNDSRINL